MAVIEVKELHQRRRSSVKDGQVTHTRAFLVTTDNIEDGTVVAISAVGVPRYGEPHPVDAACKVSSVDADPVKDSGVHFEVVVEYVSGQLVGTVGNPLDRPPEISWGGSEATAPYFLDCSAEPKPVVNSAGEPFDNYLEREVGEMVITVTCNEATHDAADADTYSHTINSHPLKLDTTTFAAGTLKLSPIQATKVKERVEEDGSVMNVTYYRRTYTIKARHEGWNDKPIDVGLNERTGDLAKGFKLKPILDQTNQPVKRPWPLDGLGKRKPNPTDKAGVLEFKPYKQVAWTGLKFANPAIWI
jgi:hypothetical protein